MKEVLVPAVCVDFKRRALHSIYLPGEEILRIIRHGGINATPKPIKLIHPTFKKIRGWEQRISVDDIWIPLAVNKTLYPDH